MSIRTCVPNLGAVQRPCRKKVSFKCISRSSWPQTLHEDVYMFAVRISRENVLVPLGRRSRHEQRPKLICYAG